MAQFKAPCPPLQQHLQFLVSPPPRSIQLPEYQNIRIDHPEESPLNLFFTSQ